MLCCLTIQCQLLPIQCVTLQTNPPFPPLKLPPYSRLNKCTSSVQVDGTSSVQIKEPAAERRAANERQQHQKYFYANYFITHSYGAVLTSRTINKIYTRMFHMVTSTSRYDVNYSVIDVIHSLDRRGRMSLEVEDYDGYSLIMTTRVIVF